MEKSAEEIPNISRKKINAIGSDPVKTAAAINLVYVNDTQPGIQRVKKGATFQYYAGKKRFQTKKFLNA